LLSTLLAAGSWLFWPTLNALIQELTPESLFAQANGLLAIAFHAGWLIAGAVVGVTYNHFGLSGVLFLDATTYALSITCYFFARRGRHTVMVASPAKHSGHVARFLREFREGAVYVRQHRRVLLLGSSWALFMAGTLLQGVIRFDAQRPGNLLTSTFRIHVLQSVEFRFGDQLEVAQPVERGLHAHAIEVGELNKVIELNFLCARVGS